MNSDIDSAAHWITDLDLSPHPEGGFFKEVYRSSLVIPREALSKEFTGGRNASTGIFYLLEQGDFSAFHRIRSDEMWHFYAGGPLELHLLRSSGHECVYLGRDVRNGEYLQYVVPAGVWFAATPALGTAYSLLGCTVSPGFDFADFEMATRDALLAEHPTHVEIVTRFTRPSALKSS